MSKNNLEYIFKEQEHLLSVFFHGVNPSVTQKIDKDTFYLLYRNNQPSPDLEALTKTKIYIDETIRFEYGVQNARKVDPRSTRRLASEDEHLADKVGRINEYRILFVIVNTVVVVIAGLLFAKSRGAIISIWNGIVVLLFFGVVISVGFYFYKLLATLYFSDRGSKYQRGYSQAKAYILKKQYDKAILEYKKETDENPADYEPHYQLAQLMESLGHYESAIPELQKAVQKAEEREVCGHIFHYMAEIYLYKIKNNVKGKHYLNKVVREYGDTKAGERAKIMLEKIS